MFVKFGGNDEDDHDDDNGDADDDADNDDDGNDDEHKEGGVDMDMTKMTGGTPEVRSDKSLTLLTFDI